MLTEKDYCDYYTCMYLIDLGYFDPDPIDWYVDDYDHIAKITLYEAKKWLREEKRICVEVTCCAGGYVWELCKAYNKDWFSGGTTIYTEDDGEKYNSYEEALSEGIKEAVKILKEE